MPLLHLPRLITTLSAAAALASCGLAYQTIDDPEAPDVADQALGANLFVNGGFETGDFSSWDQSRGARIVTRGRHSGRYAARLQTAAVVSQRLDARLRPDVLYAFSAWVRISSRASGAPKLRLSSTSDLGSPDHTLGTFLGEATATGPVGVYQQLMVRAQFTAHQLEHGVFVGVTGAEFDGTATVDDVRAEVEGSSPPPDAGASEMDSGTPAADAGGHHSDAGTHEADAGHPMPSSGNSYAMGMWSPVDRFDTCPSYPAGVTTTAEKRAYLIERHESFKVKGPDGKWYPTWHPPVDPLTGCRFGHEHGRDPSRSMLWNQVKEYFYFDENHNGQMDSAEFAAAGLPFGYVNEQFDVYNAARGVSGMRHESHIGHKVEWANDETDVATHVMPTAPNGGVWVGKLGDGVVEFDTGVRCYYLGKPHQGVSGNDAFINNIHEVYYFQDCRLASDPSRNARVSLAMMEGFGDPGGFFSFRPLCGEQTRNNPTSLVCPFGQASPGVCSRQTENISYPAGNGSRELITRDCVESGFLVDSSRFSGNLYEAWSASLEVGESGTEILSGVNLLFDVLDPTRYYYPESLKVMRGYRTDAPLNTGYSMDLCYETLSNRSPRGGPCSWATNYGSLTDVTWDDPRSAFIGLSRGMYFQPPVIRNAGGPRDWFTDPFGKVRSRSPFPGSVRQSIEPKDIDYSSLIGRSIDPRVVLRTHSNGNGTVHAPN